MPLPAITASRTPINDLPFLFPGQAQKEAYVNEALARLDALAQRVVLGELGSPPADPDPGDSYLVADAAAQDWAGHDRAVAVWAESQWLFLPPQTGARVFDVSEGAFAHYDAAGGWQRVAAPALPAGGSIQDSEARGAIASLVSALRAAGIFSA